MNKHIFKKLLYSCCYILSGLLACSSEFIESVHLTKDNYVGIIGEINDTTSAKFSNDLHSLMLMNNNYTRDDEIYVYIDSPGGYVDYGFNIVSEIKKYNLSCVAVNAYSMAFTIFQACAVRYISETGKLMQHQMSYGIAGNHLQILSQIDLMKQMNSYLMQLQADRIGISVDVFEQLVSNDWWLFSNVAVEMNCADKIVQIWCSNDIIYEERCPMVVGSLKLGQ